jgi:hypothetical protein
MKTLKILGVHGLGDHRTSTWKRDWQDAVTASFPGQDAIRLEFSFLTYDDIFEQVDLTVWETMQAVWKLSRSAISGLFRRRGVIEEVSDRVRWTAGYVVAWVEDKEFQAKTRARVLETIAREQPDLILAHSLGSLVTYNAFTHPDAAKPEIAGPLSKTRYVTLGSQLGNAFVIGNLTPGRIAPLPMRSWHHLYNKNDDVFTAPIRLFDMPGFRQVETPFDIDGFADHSPVEYLKHSATVSDVWRPVAETRINARAFGASRQIHRRESAAALTARCSWASTSIPPKKIASKAASTTCSS